MFETIIVYIMIYSFPLLFLGKAKSLNIRSTASLNTNLFFYLGIIFFSLFVGLRWNVGIDYPAYYDLLRGYNLYATELGRLEFIPRITIDFIRDTKIPFYWWFIAMAFIQLYFFCMTFNSRLKSFVVWGVFFYLTSQLGFLMNVVRQACALSIVLYSYTFLINKNIKTYVIWILVASLFHTSALICLPLIFLYRFNINRLGRVSQIVILLSLYVFGDSIVHTILDMASRFLSGFTYLAKIQKLSDSSLVIAQGTSLGVLYYYLRYIVLIVYSKKLSTEYNIYGFGFFYMLSFIGMAFYNATMYNMLLSRMMMYFSVCSIVCLAMLMVYLSSKPKNSIDYAIFIILAILECMITLYSIISGEPWSFVWDAKYLWY